MTENGYCPRCRRVVMVVRDEINPFLMCILLFTGIGWIIYLIIWITSPKNHCIICNGKCDISAGGIAHGAAENPQYTGRLPAGPQARAGQTQVTPITVQQPIYAQPPSASANAGASPTSSPGSDAPRFCPYCAADISREMRHCPSCGTDLTDRF
jgi:hypothetical protein